MRLVMVMGGLLAGLTVACGARTSLGLDEDDTLTGVGGQAGAAQGGAGGVSAGKGGSPTSGQGGAGAGQAGKGGAGVGGAGKGGAGAGGAGKGGAGQGGGGSAGAPPPECTFDAQCDDEIPCTQDFCGPQGTCQHLGNDAQCDDGLFCTGKEQCLEGVGCVATPVACADGVGCTNDVCDEGVQGCVFTPDDTLCPLSHKCGPSEGCYALAYAHSSTTLYEVRLPSGQVTPIGPLGLAPNQQLTDIALLSNAELYGLTFTQLFKIDTQTGEANLVQPVNASQAVAFDVSPSGELFIGGNQSIYRLDLVSGTTSLAGTYPDGLEASGDLAVLQGRLLGTARQGFQGGNDSLVEFDVASGTAKVLGPTGHNCIWGLAAFGATLYGLTCDGEVLNIDPQSGAAQVLSTGGPAFWGASAR